MPPKLQVLIVVDVQGAVDAAELEALLPPALHADRRIFSLVQYGAPLVVRQGAEAQPIDWPGLGRAVEAVATAVRAASAGRTLDLYVGGQGPPVVFAHLGHAVSKFNGSQTLLARRGSGAPLEWFPLAGGGEAPPRLTARSLPESPSPASGQVAVYVDVLPRCDEAKLRSAIARTGERLAGVVELRPPVALTVDPENAAGLAAELERAFSRLPALHPHASFGLFPAGPISLAFAAGRALNPTVVASTMLYDHDRDVYEAAYSLPFESLAEPSLPIDAGSVAARAEVAAVLLGAIDALRAEVIEADLECVPRAERERFLERLAALRYEDTDRPEFSLSVAHGTFSFGAGLLEALRGGEEDLQKRFAQLLLLHELAHEPQGIRSTNYYEVGRAGVVLEAIDFAADVLALRVVMARSLRRLGSTITAEAIAVEATRWMDAVLYGLQAFDRWQHGPRIGELVDRRLRRYLTWHLQRVRAETVETAAHVVTLLEPSVTVELAPVSARLDRRGDRVVVAATPLTELFAAIGDRLLRHARAPGFDPGSLVEAVRSHDNAAIQQAMRYVLGEGRAILAPWRP